MHPDRPRTIACWFELASTYSYIAAHRAPALASRHGVHLQWRPFLLGPVFGAQGWRDSPFNLYPAKGAYMWRDMERLCHRLGLPFRRPSRFPRNCLLAARVACAHAEAPWCPDFVRAVYRANFADDLEVGERAVIERLLASVGQDAQPVLAHAETPEMKAKLRQHTEEAVALGIFGAPTFVVGRELFWGNDRLQDAIDWAIAR